MRHSGVAANSLALAAIGVCAGVLLSLMHGALAERLQSTQHNAALRTLAEVLPARVFDPGLLDSTVKVADRQLLGYANPRLAHIARRAGRAEIVILPVRAPNGYGGAIELLVGVDREGVLSAVRVLSHHETSGLGDAIELRNSRWILSFDGKSLHDPEPESWAVRKDAGAFDQFTGATVTPRAVTAAVKRALQYFSANRTRLLGDDGDGAAHAQ